MSPARRGLRTRLLAVAAAAAALLSGALAVPRAASAAAPSTPATDAFYSYSGSLAPIAPGTVLRARSVVVALGDRVPALPATQVLYRTSDQLGKPSATVATILRPAVALGPVKLISYQTAYDGLAGTCRPSYQLRGGAPASRTLEAENLLITAYLAQGFTVVSSDYEGPTDDFGAGREEAHGTLDAIRAAENELGVGAGTPVGLVGYSGGSIASMWASQLAPSYAPELHIVGVAAGGIPVDFVHNLDYIDGSSGWAGAIPAVGLGLARAYRIDLDRYLNARGKQIVAHVAQGCLDESAYPGLTFADMLKARYRNWQHVPVFERIFDDSIMGRGPTPREPLLMGVGNYDGTGDGVMVAKDVQQLAYEYCTRGVPVQFHTYSGANHIEAAVPFELQAVPFLQARFAGAGARGNCGTFGPGNPLTPLPHS